MKQVESIAITDWDDTNPIQVTVVVASSDPTKNGIVALNPDGTIIGS